MAYLGSRYSLPRSIPIKRLFAEDNLNICSHLGLARMVGALGIALTNRTLARIGEIERGFLKVYWIFRHQLIFPSSAFSQRLVNRATFRSW